MSDPSAPSPSTPNPPSDIGTDDLVVRLRQRVQERRDAGEYSAELESELNAHFERIVHHRELTEAGTVLADRIQSMGQLLNFDRTPVSTASGVPGVAVVHKVVNKAVARNNSHLYDQLNDFADVVRDALNLLASAVRDPITHRHGDVLNQLDATISRLDSYERTPVDHAAALGDLRRRLEILERAQTAP